LVKEGIFVHFGTFSALVIFTLVFFFVYYWFREQACIIVCPYGRLQGVLLDRNSILVAYDYVRGEPRGKMSDLTSDKGDCVNCHACVRVCPTGIDIRNGTQLECVNCTACIDACDHIMESIHRPTNLIKFASERNIADHKPTRFTTKMKAYSLIMLLLIGVEVYLLTSRTDIGVTILRTPGQLFQEPNDSTITNLYNYTILNKTFDAKTIELQPNNFKGSVALVGEKNIQLKSNQSYNGSLFVSINKNDIQERSTKLKIDVFENKQKVTTITIHFLGPFKFK
jgi:cytochrome c oxidase accessory protein FixG